MRNRDFQFVVTWKLFWLSGSGHWDLGFSGHDWDSSITIGGHEGHVVPIVKQIGEIV